ncbi:MAG: TetR/AcrR family transcriptional regulator [Deltaproteobacteria bacterium]|jgi:AcrR family transcriptional regulator|nr:TetR/AcrR family transcriptional regulator [Deltaproteobacteria bacterium]
MARPRSDIAPRILHAARERFLAEGVDGASLRAIAEGAGTGIGMVYYYYPTKDDLFFAAVEETYATVLADLAAAADPAFTVEERIRRVYQRLAAFSDEELLTMRLVVREVLADNHRLGGILERFQHGHIPLILQTMVEGLGNGTFRPDLPLPVAMLAVLAVGAVPQFLRRFVGDRLPVGALPEGPVLAELLLSVLFRGIGAEVRPRLEPASAPPSPTRPAPSAGRSARRSKPRGRGPKGSK